MFHVNCFLKVTKSDPDRLIGPKVISDFKITPKTFRNRSKSVGDGLGVYFPTFSTFSENFIFWPFWPDWPYKMSQLGPKWPKMVIFGPFLAILVVQKVGYPPKSNRMRSRNPRGYPPSISPTSMGSGEAPWQTPRPL